MRRREGERDETRRIDYLQVSFPSGALPVSDATRSSQARISTRTRTLYSALSLSLSLSHTHTQYPYRKFMVHQPITSAADNVRRPELRHTSLTTSANLHLQPLLPLQIILRAKPPTHMTSQNRTHLRRYCVSQLSAMNVRLWIRSESREQ